MKAATMATTLYASTGAVICFRAVLAAYLAVNSPNPSMAPLSTEHRLRALGILSIICFICASVAAISAVWVSGKRIWQRVAITAAVIALFVAVAISGTSSQDLFGN